MRSRKVVAALGTAVVLGAWATAAETLVFTQEPEGAWKAAAAAGGVGRKPEGARVVVLEPGKDVRVVSAGFASACDPCVSLDGRRMLFAGKRAASDSWNVFEIDVDGAEVRQITEGLGDATDPAYLARGAITAPEYRDKVRWIVFAAARDGVSALEVRSLEPVPGRGIVTWRTTYNPAGDYAPTVLGDGRVLYASLYDARLTGAAPGAARRSALFTVSWSGEDVNLFCANDATHALKAAACELPDRSVVYVESAFERADGAGALARVLLRRPLATRAVLAQGSFRTPHAGTDGTLLVSCAPPGKTFGVYRFDTARGELGASLFDDPAWHDVDAAPVAPRAEPIGRISMVDDGRKTAMLTCLDVYDTDRPDVAAIPRGAVKSVRFVEHVPGAAPRILGEAPVEADGSFLAEVAADTPFFIQTLDAGGMALASMPVWMGLRPRDERSCMGCHEDKELSPRNIVTRSILRGAASPVATPVAERRGTAFRAAAAAVVARRCIECHGGAAPKASLALEGDGAAKALARFVVPGNARASALVRRVTGAEPKSSPCVLADAAERRALIEWVDVGAAYDVEK
jgi:hypothetical protein